MKIRQVNRTATMAWSSGQHSPLVALGTASGALDASFSTKSELEIFDLDLDKGRTPDVEMKRIGIANTNSRFNRLAWGTSSDRSKPYGILASGMENGDLEFWNPQGIINGDANALLMRHSMHSGPVRGLDFNPFQGNLLASSSSDGELFIWDLNNPTKPYSPGSKSQKLEDVTSVSWNRKFSYILASTSNNGNTVVWDLRNRKEIICLQHPLGRRPITSVTWNPDESTQFIVSSDDDSSPIIHLWDLRNARAPKMGLQGHTKGVLSVSWCPKDSELLLSAGKDNRTICWNPLTGEMIGEFERCDNWTFDAQWNYRNPDYVSVCSYDGSVKLFSLQSNSTEDTNPQNSNTQQINNDPFNIDNKMDSQTSFSLKQPPKWYKRPVGAVWTFGGKLVMFNEKQTHSIQLSQQQGQPNQQIKNPSVTIKKVVTEPTFVHNVNKLDAAEKEASFETYMNYCDEKIKDLNADPKADAQEKTIWSFLKVMFDKSPREKMLEFLGFERSQLNQDELVAMLRRLNIEPSLPPKSPEPESLVPAVEAQSVETPAVTNQGNEGLFGTSEGQQNSFYENMTPAEPTAPVEATSAPSEVKQEITIAEDSIKLFPNGQTNESDSESIIDSMIIKYLLIGDFDSAVQLCFTTNRLADALIMAICGSPELLAKARKEFFKRKRDEKVYMAVLENIANGHVKEMISAINLNDSMEKGSWKDIMALICTYAKMDEFASLCGSLGKKLEQRIKQNLTHDLKDAEETKLATVLCYLAAGELDKVVEIWLSEKNAADYTLTKLSGYSEYASKIQRLIERVTILRKAISFIDTEFVNNTPERNGQFALHKLYEKYAEYAEILVNQGKLDEAWTFLELIPESFQFWGSELVQSLRDRIFRNGNYSVPDGRQPPQPPFEITDITYVPQQQVQPQMNAYMNNTSTAYGTTQYGTNIATNTATSYGTTGYINPYATTATSSYQSNNLYYNNTTNNTMTSPYMPYNTAPTSTATTNNYYNNGYNNYNSNQLTSPLPKPNTITTPKITQPALYGNTTNNNNIYGTNMAATSAPTSRNDFVPPPPTIYGTNTNTLTSPMPKANTITTPKMVPPPYGGTTSNTNIYGNNLGVTNSTATATTSATTTTTRNDFTPPPLPNIYGLSSATGTSGFNSLPTISNSLSGKPMPETKPHAAPMASPMMNQRQMQMQPSMYGMPPQQNQMNPVVPAKPVEQPPAKPRYPEGDRSHIPEEYKGIEGSLTKVLEYATQCGGNQRILDDAKKKFNAFYDQLNNDDISDKAALNRLVDLCKALDINDLMTAQSINMELMTTKFEVIGHVLQCIKRLLDILTRAYVNQGGY
ncbi:WD40 repeat-like protein [Neocallimastix lanati (nom. inval.)]|jgi:protein transport protein SEC31|uniref:Protein transport protein SEC31 n=1 Tax=Neocallimastix californiae TaxID=1754190 RepID=A0A1Y2ENY1_9FUNG|nr:WD40 repeat-like protein [Neocallimastix sp. JGI-2020a]ORY73291.1 WD40 repeat-like protein [Neocallimastix californiae]|eukprot:ORY73291.1 WD40 repeat-like protein [Neocallimastix californiae]